jgi:hypothetical protein
VVRSLPKCFDFGSQACRDGIQFALDRGVQRLVLETDCQVLVNFWEQRRSKVSPILQQIENLSRSLDDFSLIFFSSRSYNSQLINVQSSYTVRTRWRSGLSHHRAYGGIKENDCNHAHDE